MTEILGLIVAIWLIIYVQRLRALLAFPLPRRRYQPLAAMPSEHADAVFDELHTELTKLGFEGPVWLRAERVDGESETTPLYAIYRAPDDCGLFWASAPSQVAHPHQAMTFFSHRLADGRHAVSQPFDIGFALMEGGKLVARSASEATIAKQWQAHLVWLAALGSAPLPCVDLDLPSYALDLFERSRERLVASRNVREVTPDLALLRLPLAMKAMTAMRRLPKPPADPRPVPLPRLARLAAAQDISSHRAPPRDVQWGVFAVSVVLFMALGALFWDVTLALSILLVVVLHELGHFLAMRAFGYRNVHMLALPLVGGVAIGQDANPGASKRAWMSLMGPLPGIVIGWVLLGFAWQSGLDSPAWLLSLAMVFLFINYLNVLPIPPLDGAHVVEALLPVRWAKLQTVLIAIAAVVGAYFAWQYSFYLLTVLALLQLPALAANWRLHEVELGLLQTGLPKSDAPRDRMLQILGALEAKLGPTSHALVRVRQALSVRQRIEVQPMGAAARLATSLVYLILLLVPVVGLLGYSHLLGGDPEQRARSEEQANSRVALQAEAAKLALATLVRDLAIGADNALPEAASPAAFARAEARLGRPLPLELRSLYEVADGLPAIDLLPLDEVGPPSPQTVQMLGAVDQRLRLENNAGVWVELESATAERWWHLGGWEDAPLFYLPDPHPRLPTTRFINYFIESPSVHPSLRDFLDQQWADQRLTKQAD